MHLKDYQTKTLHILETFLKEAESIGAKNAFVETAQPAANGKIPDYHELPEMEDVPYVCLRLPTGGGKTILATHSIKVAAANYLEEEFPFVLWLVPTTTIAEQTLNCLLNPDHPYREAINEKYGSNVRILSVSDFDLVRPDDLENRLCILVGTFASLRVKETDDRNIYKENEAFETHFSGLNIEHLGLERNESGERKGKVKLSFANLVKIHRPLLILDEAHNAKTKLTSDVIKRINPKCILEFTATPHLTGELRTNILYSVSAASLKAEDKSNKSVLFLMVTKKDSKGNGVRAQILEKIR